MISKGIPHSSYSAFEPPTLNAKRTERNKYSPKSMHFLLPAFATGSIIQCPMYSVNFVIKCVHGFLKGYLKIARLYLSIIPLNTSISCVQAE